MINTIRVSTHILRTAFAIAGIFFANNVAAQSVACAANESLQNLDGGTYPWAAGSLSYSASIGSGASAVTINGNAPDPQGYYVSGYPVTETQFGGLANAFGFKVDRPDVTSSNTITYTFSKPVNNLVITAGDIDRYGNANRYADMVTITGMSPGGATVNPTGTAASNLITVNGTSAYPSGNAADGTNCAAADSSCNATFSFYAPITSLTIVYGNNAPPARGDPIAQEVSLSFGGFCVQNPNPGITKNAPANALVGTAFDFTLQANNAGSAAAPTGVQVNDTIDAGKYTINSITPASGWTCARVPNSAFPINSGSIAITCTSTATISAGASGVAVATINVTPKLAATPGPITNTATIPSGSGGDISTANNSSSTSTTLKVPTDLSITKSDGATTAVTGSVITYTLTVANSGAYSVTGATVKDTPVTGLTCPTANTVSCSGTGCPAGPITNNALMTGAGITMGAMTAGSSATLTVTCNVN